MPRRRVTNRRATSGGASAGPPAKAVFSLAASSASTTVGVSVGRAFYRTAVVSSGGSLSGPSVSGVSYSAGSGWLSAVFEPTAAGYDLVCTIDPDGLAEGAYVATVTCADANADETPTFELTANIVNDAPARLGIAFTTHLAQATVGGANPASVTVALLNVGGGALGTQSVFSGPTYSGDFSGWVDAVTFDAVAGTMTVDFDTSAIAASGSANARFVIGDSVANNEVALTVQLQMGAAVSLPSLQVSQSNIAEVIQLGATPSPTVLTISNANGTLAELGTLGVSEQSATAWIAESISGSQLTITWNTAALTAGAYSAKLNITSSTATNSPVTVNVDLTVQPAASVGDPVLPTEYTWSVPAVTGTTYTVTTAAQFQTALNTCARGDEIVIPAGTTLVGAFILRPKAGTVAANGWITIRSSGLSSIPAGQRFRPSVHAPYAATLMSPNADPALKTEVPGSNTISGYYIAGLRFDTDPNWTNVSYGLLWLGSGQARSDPQQGNIPWQITYDMVAEDFIVDRCWFEQTKTTQVCQRAIALNAKKVAIVNSWIQAGYGFQVESQAIGGWNGPGYYTIENNYCQAGGQHVFFGGADPGIPGLNVQHLVVRRNHMFRPQAWRNPVGITLVKTSFELKTGEYVLFEQNVLDGVWLNGQTGYAFVVWNTNQGGGNPTATTHDVTIRRNYIVNMGAGAQCNGMGGYGTNDVAHNVLYEDNYWLNCNVPLYPGAGIWWQFAGMRNLKIRRNTMIGGTGNALKNAIAFDTGNSTKRSAFGVEFVDNVQDIGQYGWFSSAGTGMSAFTINCDPPIVVTGNVLIGASRSGYPGVTFVANEAAAMALGKGVTLGAVQNWTSGVVVAR